MLYIRKTDKNSVHLYTDNQKLTPNMFRTASGAPGPARQSEARRPRQRERRPHRSDPEAQLPGLPGDHPRPHGAGWRRGGQCRPFPRTGAGGLPVPEGGARHRRRPDAGAGGRFERAAPEETRRVAAGVPVPVVAGGVQGGGSESTVMIEGVLRTL